MSFELVHSGVAHDENPPGRGSGRYPYGSGENPGQHQDSFLSQVSRLKKRGYTQSEIAKELLGQKGVNKNTGEPIWATTTDLRARIAIENAKQRNADRDRALQLYIECDGNVSEIGRRMGRNESSVRSLLKEEINERNNRYEKTAELLKSRIDEKGFIDISSGSELYMGVSDYTKKVASAMLVQEGYVKTWIAIDQQFGQGNKTTIAVLARKPAEGETEKDVRSWVQKHKNEVGTIQDFTPDGGKTWWTPEYPAMLDSSRIMIRYAEDGGKDKDGVIEIRRGVEDVSLGNSRYAQVRIGVDGTHYMKGMAMYGDDEEFAKLPKGVDIIYNTNKHRGVPMKNDDAYYDLETHDWVGKEVLKRMKIDERTMEVDKENPFGALIKNEKEVNGVILAGGQRHYIDENGNSKLSPINKLRDEGDWDSWSKNLSSQFLSKQPMKLIKQQLDLSLSEKKLEFEEINNLTNPVIKKKLLDEFANECDSAASNLSAKGFKGQAFQVLLPVSSLKDNEIYAPNYQDGDTVALIRYPHAGIFEIPVLTVNNKHEGAQRVMKGALDAVGINTTVAAQLSGADFDGDTAVVIPLKSNNIGVSSMKPLPGLRNFEPKELYSLPDSHPRISNHTKQLLMGEVTNLITDMTAQGAPFSEVERAVRHSMVVIDAQKHNLDYKKSAEIERIDDLKQKYQKLENKATAGGASTIFSRAGATVYVNQRKEVTDVKKMTPEEVELFRNGEKIYHETGKTKMVQVKDPKKMTSDELERYRAGKKVYRQSDEKVTQKISGMDSVSDAFDLVRNPSNEKERAYAEYANALKDLARGARKESRSIKPYPINSEAKKTYAKEVASLTKQLEEAQMNQPRERKAQALAGIIVSQRYASNPDMDYEHRRRESARALTQARAIVGAKKKQITISDSEWDAIQSHAISSTKLAAILNNTNQDAFKQRATPRKNKNTLTSAQEDLARSMAKAGRTTADIAERLGVSSSTIVNILKN